MPHYQVVTREDGALGAFELDAVLQVGDLIVDSALPWLVELEESSRMRRRKGGVLLRRQLQARIAAADMAERQLPA